MKDKKVKHAQVERPAIDRMAGANVQEKVRQIRSLRPIGQTLSEQVRHILEEEK